MTSPEEKTKQDGTDPRAVLFVTMMASFSTPFVLSAINIALPDMAADLGMTARALPWVSLSFLAAAGVLLVPMGKLADIYGRKRVFRLGFSLFTLASLLCALANSAGWLIFFRFLQGVGSSMVFGTGVAILTSVFPPARLGRAIGLTTASVYTGLCAGPVLGGAMVAAMGWRSIFYANVLIGLAVLWEMARSMKGEWRDARGDTFDLKGALVYVLSMSLLVTGTAAAATALGAALGAAGLAGLVLFARHELRAEHPVLDVKMMAANPGLLFSNLAALINYSATFSIGFLLSLYLQYVKGLGPGQAGLILLWMPALMALFSPLAGRMADKRDPGLIASAGMIVCTAGVLFFVFISAGSPVWLISAGLAVTGLGLALFSAPNTISVMSAVTPRYYSMASSTLSTMRVAGQMISMVAVAVIFTFYLGGTRLSPEKAEGLIQSSRAAMFLSAGLCAAGIYASLKRGKYPREAARS